MVAIRAWVRRGLAFHAEFLRLREGSEGAQITTWIADHPDIKAIQNFKSLAIPRPQVQKRRDGKWLYTPPRLLTGSFSHVDRDAARNLSAVVFGPYLLASAFAKDLYTCSQVKLCAELKLYNSGDTPADLAPQLLETMNTLATHLWRGGNFKATDRRVITVQYDMVKTLPGVVYFNVRTQTEQKLVSQQMWMDIVKFHNEENDITELPCYIEGEYGTMTLAALIDLDACARATLRLNPEGRQRSESSLYVTRDFACASRFRRPT
jgi:hypothetical protein